MILVLGVIERLSRLANLISIERDWVPKLAAAIQPDNESAPYDLTQLNAVMSRIDLICKLGAPILISMIMSVTKLTWLGPVGMIFVNLITWPFEYWTARTVWQGSKDLQELKQERSTSALQAGDTEKEALATAPFGFHFWDTVIRVGSYMWLWLHDYISSLNSYFATDIWMASMATTGLHFSVLAFSGILTVFLVNSGFSLSLVTWAEVLSAVFEISSTYLFPLGVQYLSIQRTSYQTLSQTSMNSPPGSPSLSTFEASDDKRLVDDLSFHNDQRRGVSKLGFWGLVFMLICLVSQMLRGYNAG